MAKHLVINKRAEIEDTGVSLESLLSRVVALEGSTSSGSNTNGNWLRVGPVQICWKSAIVTTKNGNSTTWGNTWWATGITWTYPQAFKSGTEPSVSATALDNQSGLFAAALNGTPGATSVQFESFGSANYTTCYVFCIAIGVWK